MIIRLWRSWLGARSANADARLCTSSGINLIVPLSFQADCGGGRNIGLYKITILRVGDTSTNRMAGVMLVIIKIPPSLGI